MPEFIKMVENAKKRRRNKGTLTGKSDYAVRASEAASAVGAVDGLVAVGATFENTAVGMVNTDLEDKI